MSQNDMNTLSQKINELKKQGYKEDFEIEHAEAIKCLGTKNLYPPEAIHVKGVFRFEGDTNPADMSVLYALEADDGVKGLVVDSFGPKSNEYLDDFVKETHWDEKLS